MAGRKKGLVNLGNVVGWLGLKIVM
jgi:hypothetical protein